MNKNNKNLDGQTVIKGFENELDEEVLEGAAEGVSEFAKRVGYGRQLMEMMALADVGIDSLEEEVPYIHAVLTDNRLPGVQDEFYLMAKIGYIPLFSFVSKDSKEMSEVWFDTQQALLSEVMVKSKLTLKKLTSFLKANGFVNYSVPGNVLRGNNCSYNSLKDILENLGYKLDIILAKVDGEGMCRYVNMLENAKRDTRVYERKIRELKEAAEKGFYSYAKNMVKPKNKPRKPQTLEDKLKKIDRVVFVDNFTSKTVADPETVLSGYSATVRDKFTKLDLTSIEIAKKMSGRNLKIRIEVDPDVVNKKLSKAYRGATNKNCNSLKEAIEFIYTVYYGGVQDSNKSAAMAKVYNGSSALSIKVFNTFLKAHNAIAYIAI